MKKLIKRILALAITFMLVLPAGLAEKMAQDAQAADVVSVQAAFDTEDVDGEEISSDAVDLEVGEADDVELGGEDSASSEDGGAVTTYWFMVGNALFSEQAVEDGEAIAKPDDPEAPEGSVFAGWFTEDGVQLFLDEEEISHADVEAPFVNILARFEAAFDDTETETEGSDDTTEGEEVGDTSVDDEGSDTPAESDGFGEEAAPENTVFDETGDDDEADTEDTADPVSGEETDEKGDAEGVNDDVASDDEGKEDTDGASDENDEGETSPDNEGENEPDDEGKGTPDGDGETDPDEDGDAAETPDGEADEATEPAAEAIPVRVAFITVPEDAVLSVYAALQEEEEEEEEEEELEEASGEDGEEENSVDVQSEIKAEEDGAYMLLPGEYTYSASAEGYITLEAVPFTVAEEPLEIAFELEAEAVEEPEEPVPFDQSCTVGTVTITVRAEAGAFPADAELVVGLVNIKARQEADEAIDEIRDEDKNVAAAYTYDIKVVDAEGNELQPADGYNVEVSFAMAQAADGNLEANVYHITEEGGELTAEKLVADVDESAETITATTEGFSIYTIEFTYETMVYRLRYGDSVAVSNIMQTFGLSGTVDSVVLNDESPLRATETNGGWYIAAKQLFAVDQMITVTLAGGSTGYEIAIQPRLLHDGFTFEPWTSADQLPDEAGNHYLANDVTLSQNWEVPAGVTRLFLNGFSVNLGTSNYVYINEPNSILALYDEDDAGRITGGDGVWVHQAGASFELHGGEISGNNEAGVTVDSGGSFTMSGGAISGNTATNGGGVNVYGGSFTMSGGEISGNTASCDGGGVYVNSGSFTMSGGEISGNTATGNGIVYGGGVFINCSTFNLSGNPRVLDNTVRQGEAVTPNNVETDRAITISGALAGGCSVGITWYGDGDFTSNYSAKMESDAPSNYFFSDDATKEVTWNADSTEATLRTPGDTVDLRYRDYNASTRRFTTTRITDYMAITDSIAEWSNGWYVVNSATPVTIDGRVTVTGDVHLILCDGCTLTAKKGIGVSNGNSLTIYAGTTSSAPVAGTGVLNAGETSNEGNWKGAGAGIGGSGEGGHCGAVTINGGTVNAYGSIGEKIDENTWTAGGAGIGGGGGGGNGGAITVNGGTVTAIGGAGAGIGGGCGGPSNQKGGHGGTVTINGGAVYAYGSKMDSQGWPLNGGGAGIGGGISYLGNGGDGGMVTVNGGAVTAVGAGGAGIGGGGSGDVTNTGKGGHGGTLTVNGGTVNASVSGYFIGGAGIGGGSSESGDGGDGGRVTVNDGGHIKAIGCKGAGIGGGYSGNGDSSGNGGNGGTFTVNDGGHVEATGNNGAGIGGGGSLQGSGGNGGTMTVNGGTVIANTSYDISYDAGIGGGGGKTGGSGGTVTVNAGTVTATGSIDGAGIGGGNGGNGGKITITGGTVTACSDKENSPSRGAGIGGGYGGNGGDIAITGGTVKVNKSYGLGQLIGHGHGNNAPGTLSLSHMKAFDSAEGGSEIVAGDVLNACRSNGNFASIRLEACADHSNDCQYCGYNGLSYLDAQGKVRRQLNNYTEISPNNRLTDLTSGWYAVTANVIIENRMSVSGNVNLVLCDGTTLTAKKGITVTLSGDNSLTIWAQSDGDGMGKLYAGTTDGKDNTCEQESAGIGGYYNYEPWSDRYGGTITINGGKIVAKGGTVGTSNYRCGAGIGGSYDGSGGSIAINGGTVIADSTYGAGIGGGWYTNYGDENSGSSGDIAINGGTVTATSVNGAGIGGGSGGSGGSIAINGGTVTATSVNGAGIGGGFGGSGGTLTLSYTRASKTGMSVTASSYNGTVKLEKPFIALKRNVSLEPGVVLDATAKDAGVPVNMVATLANKDIVPFTGTAYDIAVASNPAITGEVDITVNDVAVTRAAAGSTVTLTLPQGAYQCGPILVTEDQSPNTEVVFNVTNQEGVYTFQMPNFDVTLDFSQWGKLQAQIDAAAKTAGGGTVTLGSDVAANPDVDVNPLTVPAGNPVTINLNGHTIDRGLMGEGKTAQPDGNVITVNGTLTVTDSGTGGTITGGNNSGYGGGVIVSGENAKFTLAGSAIVTGNSALKGGGVYVGAGGTLALSGTPQIDKNTNGNVYLATGRTIEISEDLKNEHSFSFSMEKPGTFTSGRPFASVIDARNVFASEDGNHPQINLTFEGCATLGVAEVKEGSETAEPQIFMDLSTAIAACDDSVLNILILLADASIADSLSTSGNNITLDLNGYGILMNGNGSVITVAEKQSLTLADSNSRRTHYITLEDGRGTWVSDSKPESTTEYIEVTGGYITGGSGTGDYGGGVFVNGAFTMDGGTICGNVAKRHGGGVYVKEGCAFTMWSGAICDNKAGTSGGGVFAEGSGTISISGKPKITGNKVGDAANNLYLQNGKTIAVTGKLTEDAQIGVMTEQKPAKEGLQPLTCGLGQKGNDDVAAFTSDDDTYSVGWNDAKTEAVLGQTMALKPGNYEGVYDGQPHGIAVEVTVPKSGATVMYGEKEGTYDKTELTYRDVGSHTVYYRVEAKGCFPQTGSAEVIINPAPLTAIAEPQSKVEGEKDPALTYEAHGLAKGDTLSGALTREAGELPGTYAIKQGSLAASSNYTMTFTGANFTIGEKPALNFNGDISQIAGATPVGKRTLAYAWSKVDGAEGYDLYFKKCDGKSNYTLLETLDGTDILNSQVTGLKKGTSYKAYIMAWRKEAGQKVYIGKASPYIHAIAGGFNKAKKICNASGVTVKKVNVSLAVGQKSRIRASVKGVKKGYKVLKHVARLRYYSSDNTVAKVNKKGRIIAVGAGTCTIYVMANNGVYSTVTVTVTN